MTAQLSYITVSTAQSFGWIPISKARLPTKDILKRANISKKQTNNMQKKEKTVTSVTAKREEKAVFLLAALLRLPLEELGLLRKSTQAREGRECKYEFIRPTQDVCEKVGGKNRTRYDCPYHASRQHRNML